MVFIYYCFIEAGIRTGGITCLAGGSTTGSAWHIATINDAIYYTTYGSISTREIINYGMLWEGVAHNGISCLVFNCHLYWLDFTLATIIIYDATWLELSHGDGIREYGPYGILVYDIYHVGINTFMPISFWSNSYWYVATICNLFKL